MTASLPFQTHCNPGDTEVANCASGGHTEMERPDGSRYYLTPRWEFVAGLGWLLVSRSPRAEDYRRNPDTL